MNFLADFRGRALLVTVGLSFGFTLVSLRLVQLQLINHDKYEEMAIENHWKRIEMPAVRGSILDSSGNVLACTRVLQEVRIDGKVFPDPSVNLPKIAQILNLSADDLAKNFDPEKRYQLIANDIPNDVASQLKDLKLSGLVFNEKQVRSYPNNAHASHLIGFVDGEQTGLAGVEKAMNKDLHGTPGERWIEKDARRREIAAYRGKDQPPRDGYNVSLTIDLTIQHIVEDELDKLVTKYQPSAAFVIAMRPKTGEILALANRPTFDPNRRDEMTVSSMRNRCLTDMFEPGSIFKIVTMAGAINEHLVTLDTPIFCENGKYFYAGRWLHDHEALGTLNVEQILAHSSNIGFAKLGEALGEDRLYQYAVDFGFGQPTGVLPGQGESFGLLRPPSRWSKVSITRIPMGQEVAATPLQMINALCAIANRGRLMAPQLIKQVSDSDGRVVKVYHPRVIRQIITPETASLVSKALVSVVSEEGTGKNAAIKDLTVAGKTGTAQKFVDGAYSHEKYTASFMGYFPEEDPQVAILVMVDEPQGKQFYGGEVAAPAFSEIGTQIAQCLNLQPSNVSTEPVQRAAL